MEQEIAAVNAGLSSLRMPHYKMPSRACDTHCHVLGPIDRFPYADARHYTPEEKDKWVLSALHARLGVDRSVIVQATVYGTDNRIVLDAIADRPDSRRGIALVDASISEAELEILHEGGIRGVRFGFIPKLWTPPERAVFRLVAAKIAAFGWHIAVHVNASDLETLQPYFDDLPVPFVIDHMGRVDVADAAGLAQPGFKNLLAWAEREACWIKVSAIDRVSATGRPFTDTVPYVRALLAAAPDRVLWGTDFPHPNPRNAVDDDADLVDVLPLCGDADALRKLLVKNPARLYGF